MILTDVAMIAAETSRSSVYLQALLRNQMPPNHVLVLKNSSDNALPGQPAKTNVSSTNARIEETDECWSEANFDRGASVTGLVEKYHIPHQIAPTDNINDLSVVALIKHRPEPVFIYSGYGGVLLKDDILSTGKYFLHVHGGYLPDYKGSTTNYYSLIEEKTLGASALFLNEKIDSGPVLLRRKFPAPKNRLEIDHVYDSAARAKVLIETLESYIRHGKWKCDIDINSGGETYYIIHPLLKHLAILGN